MVNVVKIKRGSKANLPASGSDGELIYAKNTNELFIANDSSVVRVNDGVVGTATQTALDAKVPTSRTVAGRALTADVPRAALNTLGLGEAIFIPKNGTVPGGTPTYTIVIEAEA